MIHDNTEHRIDKAQNSTRIRKTDAEKREYRVSISELIPKTSFNQKEFLNDRHGPWPQPSPFSPEGVAPGVPKIPLAETIEWYLNHYVRYFKQRHFGQFKERLRVIQNSGIVEVSDKEFNKLLTDSVLSKHLNNNLDSFDKMIFEDFINKDSELQDYYKIDLTPMEVVENYPGLYTAPTISLFKVNQGNIEIVGIWITGQVLTNKDGECFELAKYFVLQGAATCSTLVLHPNIHFPMDPINAISKTILPKNNLLLKLLMPHLQFSLGVSKAVLYRKSSIINNTEKLIYGSYQGPSNGLRKLLILGYQGIPGNSSYNSWSYPKMPSKIHSPYGDFRNSYWEVIRNFVKKVVPYIDINDPNVKLWADSCAQYVRGFPNRDSIEDIEVFIDAVAYFIWNASIGHAVDHYCFGKLPKNKVPLRLRQEPPSFGRKLKKLDREKLTSKKDTLKYYMANKMFYSPNNITLLYDTDYKFKNNSLKKINQEFLNDLKYLDNNLPTKRYIPLKEISRSVQY